MKKTFNERVTILSAYIKENHLESLVLGISGGIDSTLCAAICMEACIATKIKFIALVINVIPKWNRSGFGWFTINIARIKSNCESKYPTTIREIEEKIYFSSTIEVMKEIVAT